LKDAQLDAMLAEVIAAGIIRKAVTRRRIGSKSTLNSGDEYKVRLQDDPLAAWPRPSIDGSIRDPLELDVDEYESLPTREKKILSLT
jgi:hypothetical protein